MRTLRAPIVAFASLAWLPVPLAAQEAPPVPIDSRVRVTTEARPGAPYVGTLRTWDGSGFVVEEPGPLVHRIRIPEVERFELSKGTHGHALTGGLIGFGLGALVTTFSAITNDTDTSTEFIVLAGGAVFAGGGALLGALIGSQAKTEEWNPVPLDSNRRDAPDAVAARP